MSQQQVWQVRTATYWNGGVLSTGGGLVLQGDVEGRLRAYDADSGRLLKQLELGTSIMATPMTYRIAGVQYVAVLAGYGGGQIGDPLPENSAAYRFGNEGRLIVLRLDAPPPVLPPHVQLPAAPPPPADTATAAQLHAGAVLYNRYCARCQVLGRGVLPDLRHLSPEKHQLIAQIVRGGVLDLSA